MAHVNVICWLWGKKYTADYVTRLKKAVDKHMITPHRFCVFTDQRLDLPGIDVRNIEDREWTTRSCFCRLRMFDPQWQERNNFKEPILSLDLDLIITGSLDGYVQTNSTFKILKGANAVNPNPFNASVMYLKPGYHSEVWSDFTITKAWQTPYHAFPDDQGWIWHKLPDADGWPVGAESGIYGFQKPGWPAGSAALPPNARIVSFIGKRKPAMYKDVFWVNQYLASV